MAPLYVVRGAHEDNIIDAIAISPEHSGHPPDRICIHDELAAQKSVINGWVIGDVEQLGDNARRIIDSISA
jgi:hypothetical protein